MPPVTPTYNLAVLFPDVADEWDHTLNVGCKPPEEMAPHSRLKVWWKCKKEGHSWDAIINSRTNNRIRTGCRFCAGREIDDTNSFERFHPRLADEWDRQLNGTLRPSKFSCYSIQKIWWRCRIKSEHKWYATIGSRAAGHGCPQCTGRVADSTNNLLAEYPLIAREWHPKKNGNKQPEEFRSHSNKKVWWLCPKGHEYFSTITGRTSDGKGCRRCRGMIPDEDHNLSQTYPDAASEWDYDANGTLTPQQCTPRTSKSVYWKCNIDPTHCWFASIYTRTAKSCGCPFCGGYISDTNNLAVKFPDIAKQWHPIYNGSKVPTQVSSRSSESVWWISSCGHPWIDKIINRVNGAGCSFCGYHLIRDHNHLGKDKPHLLEEWDEERNVMKITEVLPFSNKSYHWICGKCNKRFRQIACRRTFGSGCPSCNSAGITERLFREELAKYILDINHALNIVKNPSTGRWLPFDVYSSLLKIIFEVDGEQHFTKSTFFDSLTYQQIQRRDVYKMFHALREGWTIIRIYQPMLAKDIHGVVTRLVKYWIYHDMKPAFYYFEDNDKFNLYLDLMNQMKEEERTTGKIVIE